jgi:hypothetical protein
MAADSTIDDDTDETTEEGKKRRPPVDQKVLRKVARTLWTMEYKERTPESTPEQRKAAWEEEKKTVTARARKLIRKLEADDVVMTVKG